MNLAAVIINLLLLFVTLRVYDVHAAEDLYISSKNEKVQTMSCSACCSNGGEYYNEHCYIFHKNTVSWEAAVMFCKATHSDLVAIETAAEEEFITNNTQVKGIKDLWLGGTDRHNVSDWRWISTGLSLTFTNWNDNQPDNPEGNERCLASHERHNYKWNNYGCNFLLSFICESVAS